MIIRYFDNDGQLVHQHPTRGVLVDRLNILRMFAQFPMIEYAKCDGRIYVPDDIYLGRLGKPEKANGNNRGFTLVELMIVVAIIGILSAIAIPTFAGVVRRAHEGSTIANLKMLRDALARYAADHDGVYPTDDLTSLVTGNYLNKIPYTRTPPYHPGGNVVGTGTMSQQGANTGNWYFFNDPNEIRYGQIIVNCNHLTLKNQPWDTL